MLSRIGPIFGGRTLRSSLRSGQHAPLCLEILEPRLLMAGDVFGLTSASSLHLRLEVATA